MKKFTVSFFYYTDCRWIENVEAENEISALTLAMEFAHFSKWVTDKGFTISIELMENWKI